jgi:lipoprotein-anchoring transpeptidase ErfK/SrfK
MIRPGRATGPPRCNGGSGALALGLVAVVLAATGPAVAGAAPVTDAPPSAQELAILGADAPARLRPDGRARRVAVVRARRPLTAARTTLPVLGHGTDRRGAAWLRVRLPGRPNGATGWIAAAGTTDATTPWAIRVDLSDRRVRVLRAGHVVRSFLVVVGAPATPTPRGRFFVEETLRLSRSRVGAPFALALSARSNVLDQFDGGPGQIALHGVGGVGGVAGTAASHGCVRLSTPQIRWLAARIGPGVPVTITG